MKEFDLNKLSEKIKAYEKDKEELDRTFLDDFLEFCSINEESIQVFLRVLENSNFNVNLIAEYTYKAELKKASFKKDKKIDSNNELTMDKLTANVNAENQKTEEKRDNNLFSLDQFKNRQ